MKLTLVFMLIFICNEALSSELMLEISLPAGEESDLTIISQKRNAEQLSDLTDSYARIGLLSKCSTKDKNSICKIQSSYENGSIRQGYPFFLYTSNSEVGLINLSDIKKVYGGLDTSAVFTENNYTLLSTRKNLRKKIDFDDIDNNSEYVLFTAKASENQIFFQGKFRAGCLTY